MKTLLLLPAILVAVAMPVVEPVVPSQSLGEHEWVADAGHSSCVFRVKHANASWFMGTFDKVEGKATLDASALDKGSVELTIATESVDSNDKQRDGHQWHVRAPDGRTWWYSTRALHVQDRGGGQRLQILLER